jgi:hypothetical protein
LKDPSLRIEFAHQGRKTIEADYSARVQAPRVLEILEAVCRDCRQPVGDVRVGDATRD